MKSTSTPTIFFAGLAVLFFLNLAAFAIPYATPSGMNQQLPSIVVGQQYPQLVAILNFLRAFSLVLFIPSLAYCAFYPFFAQFFSQNTARTILKINVIILLLTAGFFVEATTHNTVMLEIMPFITVFLFSNIPYKFCEKFYWKHIKKSPPDMWICRKCATVNRTIDAECANCKNRPSAPSAA